MRLAVLWESGPQASPLRAQTCIEHTCRITHIIMRMVFLTDGSLRVHPSPQGPSCVQVKPDSSKRLETQAGNGTRLGAILRSKER